MCIEPGRASCLAVVGDAPCRPTRVPGPGDPKRVEQASALRSWPTRPRPARAGPLGLVVLDQARFNRARFDPGAPRRRRLLGLLPLATGVSATCPTRAPGRRRVQRVHRPDPLHDPFQTVLPDSGPARSTRRAGVRRRPLLRAGPEAPGLGTDSRRHLVRPARRGGRPGVVPSFFMPNRLEPGRLLGGGRKRKWDTARCARAEEFA